LQGQRSNQPTFIPLTGQSSVHYHVHNGKAVFKLYIIFLSKSMKVVLKVKAQGHMTPKSNHF